MKGSRLLAACVLSTFLAAGCMLPGVGSRVFAAQETTIAKGIYVEGVNVGGMTMEEAKQAIQAKVDEMGATSVTLMFADQPITTTLSELGYTWKNTDVLDGVKDFGTSGTIVDRYKALKDLEIGRKNYPLVFTVNEERVRNYVRTCSIYNSDPVEGRLYMGDSGVPEVEGGTDGLTLKVNKSAREVRNAIENWQGGDIRVDLVVERVSPKASYELLSKVKDVMGSATTDYSASSWARAVNVQNGCSLINGSVVWPGEEFSVTAAVTPFSAENGYQPAPSYEENRVVDSYGGGICQVSTTLYNAALKSEMDITARSNHTMIVTYVEPSKDAAIAEGSMDMAFVNNTDAPIYIEGYTTGATITFTIFGHDTRDPARSIEFESRVLQTIEPSGIQMYPDTTQYIGYLSQTNTPHTGYSAELWKNIYYDGVLQDSVQVNSSYYQAVGTIYSVGVKSYYPGVTQAMYQAISMNSLEAVQNVMRNGNPPPQTQNTAATDQNTGTGTDAGTGTPEGDPGAINVTTSDSTTAVMDDSGDMDDNIAFVN